MKEIMLCKLFRTRQLSGVVLLNFVGIEIKRYVQGVHSTPRVGAGRGALLRRQREYKEAIRVAQAKASVAIMAV